ncbi:MAG: hypothetical protein AB1696_28430 [Planctomycetota bacterium]
MRKRVVALVVVVLCVGSAWYMFHYHVVIKQSLSMLPAEQQKEVKAYCLKVLAQIQDGKHDDLWEQTHPVLRQGVQKAAFVAAAKAMQPRVPKTAPLSVDWGWRIVRPKGATEVVCRSSLDGSPDHYCVRGPECVRGFIIAVISVKTAPTARSAVILLCREGGALRLAGLSLVDTTYQGKDARHYEKIGRKWLASGKALSAHVALTLAVYLDSLGPNLISSDALRLRRDFAAMRTQDQLAPTWTVGNEEFRVFRVGIITTLTDIPPHISYVSRVPLGEETSRSEAEKLMGYAMDTFPELFEEFPTVLFEATERLPGKGESVKSYRSPFSVEEWKQRKGRTG